MKSKFKKGDEVFIYPFGFGNFSEEIDNTFSKIEFEKLFVTAPNYLISFTEYTLQGFSQERPSELPEIGEEIMVSDDMKAWYLRPFDGVVAAKINTGNYSWKHFKRLR